MKSIPPLLALLVVLLVPFSLAARGPSGRYGPVRVRPHMTNRGNYVAPHMRTAPNRSRYDNWSTRGNLNPYTGKRGTQRPIPLRYKTRLVN